MTANKWADPTPSVPFGGLHGSGNDKTQFQRIVELERDLAAAQDARQRAEALAERYETRLFKLGAMDDAPCFKCGYSGAGYYQPHIHDCAKKHHAASKP